MNEADSDIAKLRERAEILQARIEAAQKSPEKSKEIGQLAEMRSECLKQIAQWTLPKMRTT